MLEPYWNRLEFIREMLDSPQQEIVQEAYELLFALWLEYSINTDFHNELKKIVEKRPELVQEFTNRLYNLSCTEAEKAALLRSVTLLSAERDKGKASLLIIPKIFISYSHKDEYFKDEFVTVFAGLQRRGIIDVWQDRRIEAGVEWFDAIRQALEECDMAILLVSPDFIASRFIQETGLAHLFQQRIEEGLRVVPIIVRQCLWQSEPVIKDLQAFPKDGKPVISFSKDNGDRDQVWADICKAIEMIAAGL